jgi:hypothetical protein
VDFEMIDRESVIESSIEGYLRHQLFTVRGYPVDKVELLDAFPTDARMTKPLDKNYIAIGWSTDDGGKEAELGSPLVVRLFTFDFYVFGISRVWGKNLASVVRYSLESDGVIDLVSPSDGSPQGKVDVEFCQMQQAVAPNPRPWQEYCWVTRLRVVDYFDSSQGR